MEKKKIEKLNNEFASLPISDRDSDLKKYYKNDGIATKETKRKFSNSNIKKFAICGVAVVLFAAIIVPVSFSFLSKQNKTMSNANNNNDYLISSVVTSGIVSNNNNNNENSVVNNEIKTNSYEQAIVSKPNALDAVDADGKNAATSPTMSALIKVFSDIDKGIIKGEISRYVIGVDSGSSNYNNLANSYTYNSNVNINYKWVENICYLSFIFDDNLYEVKVSCSSQAEISLIAEKIFLSLS